jgi:hypothetical protein
MDAKSAFASMGKVCFLAREETGYESNSFEVVLDG